MNRQCTRHAPRDAAASRGARGVLCRRRGIAVLVVVLLLCVTLALSYAAVRSQSTQVQIQRNSQRQGSARQVAMTGLTIALRKMHNSAWAGVGTTLSGTLGTGESYQVSYTLGDPALTPSQPDYAEYPYRVTLLATGTAADPQNPQCVATYRIRVVVRLVPRQVPAEPSDWVTMRGYTVYQSQKDTVEIDIPCRLEGPVRIQGDLDLAKHYPNDYGAWQRYLDDLDDMRVAGQGDYRPFNGPVYLPYSEQSGPDLWALSTLLHVPTTDRWLRPNGADWVNTGEQVSYQIHPKGPTYTVPAVGATLENTTLAADPLTNPLGLYYRSGNIEIRSNVTIRGSLFCSGDINVTGTNVSLQPVELLPLYGSTGTLRVPTVTCNKFIVKPTAGGSLTGLLAVFDPFQVDKSPETVSFVITGQLITRKLFVQERQPWETLNWGDCLLAFQLQLLRPPPVIPYFPQWMGTQGRNPRPLITIKPDPTPVSYHWKKPYDPIYVPHPDDAGLRWEILDWTERL